MVSHPEPSSEIRGRTDGQTDSCVKKPLEPSSIEPSSKWLDVESEHAMTSPGHLDCDPQTGVVPGLGTARDSLETTNKSFISFSCK